MSVLTTKKFWIAQGERTVATAAQAGVAALGTGAVGLLDVDAVGVLSLMGGAAVLSVLKGLAAIPVTGGPSLAGERLREPNYAQGGHLPEA